MKPVQTAACIIAILSWGLAANVGAKVDGPCSNCHTMHNSEDGGVLVMPTEEAPLLNDDCVGCHSSTTAETIVNNNGSMIPIVYNTGGWPPQPLAGGNFFPVTQDDNFGHNVWGIADADASLSIAPGGTISCGVPTCHDSLGTDPVQNTSFYATGKNGCQGCHLHVNHHGPEPVAGQPVTAENGWYRFLGGHFSLRVPGVEAEDWEQIPSAANHNVYAGRNDDYAQFNLDPAVHTMTAFCVGCHEFIHYDRETMNDVESPWIRHPSDKALPDSGEYSGYNPVTDYDPSVPVAWTDINNPTRETAVVMCLSCHRAHGSPYPDMLRWDYSGMVSGNGGNTGQGCFVCHSQKD